MKKYLVTGFINNVWCTVTIVTIAECITTRAAELGMTEITHIEGVS